MKKGWGVLEENGSSGAQFLKLESGKTVVVHVLDNEPVVFVNHWADGRSYRCSGKPDCAGCNGGKKTTRLALNVWDYASDSVKVMENGKKLFEQINGIREAYEGSLKGVDLKIKKSGSGLDTTYLAISVPTKYNNKNKPELYDLEKIYGLKHQEQEATENDAQEDWPDEL